MISLLEFLVRDHSYALSIPVQALAEETINHLLMISNFSSITIRKDSIWKIVEETSTEVNQIEALRQTEEIIPLDQREHIRLLNMLHAEQVLDLQVLIQIHGDKVLKAKK